MGLYHLDSTSDTQINAHGVVSDISQSYFEFCESPEKSSYKLLRDVFHAVTLKPKQGQVYYSPYHKACLTEL